MGKTRIVWYRIVDQCEETYYYFDTNFDIREFPDWAWLVAENAAENYWSYHDGWDDTWPIVFILHESKGGPELARFSVDVEQTISFSADEVTDEQNQDPVDR